MIDNCSISLRLDPETKETLTEYAKEQDLSVSQVVRRAIKEYLEKNEGGQDDE
jgi:predicted transcriptional regulator